jgi:hypothetical protein
MTTEERDALHERILNIFENILWPFNKNSDRCTVGGLLDAIAAEASSSDRATKPQVIENLYQAAFGQSSQECADEKPTSHWHDYYVNLDIHVAKPQSVEQKIVFYIYITACRPEFKISIACEFHMVCPLYEGGLIFYSQELHTTPLIRLGSYAPPEIKVSITAFRAGGEAAAQDGYDWLMGNLVAAELGRGA